MIRINTDYGAIRILRAGSNPSSPPEPPEPPGKAQTTWNRQERPPRVAHRQHSVPRRRLIIADAA